MNKYFILSITNQSFAATIYVNGIPVFTDNLRNEMDKSVHINQFIVEGTNTLRIVLHVPSDLLALPDESTEFQFKVDQVIMDSDESMITTNLIEQMVKFKSGDEFPLIFNATFEAAEAYGRYDWESARQWQDQDLDRKGVIRLADKIRNAFQEKNFVAITHLLKWKRLELGRCYGFPQEELENDDKELFEGLFKNSNWALEPIDYSNLVFDLWAGCRIVQVIRPNGNELVRTVRLRESDVIYSLPLILAFIENEWRLVR